MTHRTARLLIATTALAALALSGCSSDADGGGSSSDSAASYDGPAAAAEADPSAPDADAGADSARSSVADLASGSAARPADQKAEPVDPADGFKQAVVRTGDLSMRAEDVGQARYEVQRIADRYRGEVTEENTESDGDGKPAFARMVLRVPSDDFDEAVAALGKVGEESSVSTSADDVTTQLIDLRTRVETQRRSIARISVLFEQARTIRDIMSIESELSRRQADLESMERKRAYLAGQAAMSTITVGIERIPDKKAAATGDDDHGFLAGLAAGWDALRHFGTGTATVVGALLPWLVLVALIGFPAWLLVRSTRRRTAALAPEPADGPQPTE